MRLINENLEDKVNKDFLEIQSALNYEALLDEQSSKCEKIHKSIVAIKMLFYRFGDNLKPTSLKYFNEVISDLIEAYVLLFNDRYKASKIMIRSSIDCLIRGGYLEKVGLDYKDSFTENFKNVNKEIKNSYSAKIISINFLDKAYDDMKKIFDNTSSYVHASISAELSQYRFINEILNPVENAEIKVLHTKEMEESIEQMLFRRRSFNLYIVIESA
ncbi:hypothetical protein HPL003_16325 [Paenibacillus terrae HPL-003]|uniref:Uncharacterized protein n=1 Tax=Paenibacillus terrae (strain HPL-003) TaxID=985665 RepID=G7W0S4_PAETH|nr:hypothetical protein [Paenibacillus terrae]AET60011.1 hypothetical protein HPL003_16325 [Paenibacillus terrae HPL-003]